MENNYDLGVSVKNKGARKDFAEVTKKTTASLGIADIEKVLIPKNGLNRIEKLGLFGPNNFRAAYISHYLHGNSRFKKTQAIDFTVEILELAFPDKIVTRELASQVLHPLFSKGKQLFPTLEKPKFTFIDLFAGIGGFRIALQNNGGQCVFSSEWDKMAQQTYFANFGEIPFGDITLGTTKEFIPGKFDLLCGGFPCQPFSIAGVSKKNSLGRKHGFEDEKQGNLFFHVAEIIEKHRPKAFFLENVKNLVSHDKGNTFKVIKQTLEELNYSFHSVVLNGKHFVPQNRERTFMVGFDKNVFNGKESFTFPTLPEPNQKIKDILEPKVDSKYTLSNLLWEYLQNYAKKHQAKGNGFGFGLVNMNGITRTMSARYYKDGSEILIPQGKANPRRLSVRESARLQGYPDKFNVTAVSMNQAYKQFGNSVVVPLIEAIAGQIDLVLTKKRK